MQKHFNDINIRTISTLILAVFLFAFLHSEIHLLTPKNHSHETHDFCQLVNGVTNQVRNSTIVPLLKSIVVKDIYSHYLNLFTTQAQKDRLILFKNSLFNTFSVSSFYIKYSALLI